MNAIEKLGEFKKALDVELRRYFDRKIADAKKISEEVGEMAEFIAEITLRGGKRIRPALMFYSYLAHGGKDTKRAMASAMALELAETYLLIHDDIIDGDGLRRGGPTIQISYEELAKKRFPNKIDPKYFGNSMAIMAGDMACMMSNQLISAAGFAPEVTILALQKLNKVYELEYFGETMDILSELHDDVTKADVIKVFELKTVPYTFDGPIKIGAILAGVSEEELSRLDDFINPLGTAFQIQDDILGMFGSVEKTGKPVVSDLREGKKTLLILDALEKGSDEQRKIILANLGNPDTDEAGLDAVRKVVVDTGALRASQELAVGLADKATKTLQDLEMSDEGKAFLLGIADYMIKREY